MNRVRRSIECVHSQRSQFRVTHSRIESAANQPAKVSGTGFNESLALVYGQITNLRRVNLPEWADFLPCSLCRDPVALVSEVQCSAKDCKDAVCSGVTLADCICVLSVNRA